MSVPESDRAARVLARHGQLTDPAMLDYAWEAHATKYLKRVPLPTLEAFRSVVDELAQVNPKAKGQDPKKFYDDSILRELEKSGFINALGG